MTAKDFLIKLLKESTSRSLDNAEIMTMIEAFVLKIDTKTMRITYDRDELRYGKIIIMSDADVDGSHIKNLFYTFIWNFCPQLFYDGYIYAGVPPLYKITLAGNKGYKYLKDDAALEQFKATYSGKYTVNRLKGLGEMDVTETEETLTDPNNRIIKQITIDDSEETEKLFDDLMGTAIVPRKNFIKEHSKEANI